MRPTIRVMTTCLGLAVALAAGTAVAVAGEQPGSASAVPSPEREPVTAASEAPEPTAFPVELGSFCDRPSAAR